MSNPISDRGETTMSDESLKDSKADKMSLPRTANQKPFARHDANYVCTVCKAKFFTKVDVEDHFLKHPLVEKADGK